MEMEYLQAGVDFWVYIAIAVIGWIFQLYKKYQEKAQNEQGGQFLDDQKPPVSSRPNNDFDEVLKRFSGELKQDLRTEPVKKKVTKEVPKKETMVNSLAELKSKYGNSTIMTDADRDPDKRFDDYEIKEEKKNIYANLLDDSDNFKKAFVLAEIMKRKEY